jgi:hypothetical protein
MQTKPKTLLKRPPDLYCPALGIRTPNGLIQAPQDPASYAMPKDLS